MDQWRTPIPRDLSRATLTGRLLLDRPRAPRRTGGVEARYAAADCAA